MRIGLVCHVSCRVDHVIARTGHACTKTHQTQAQIEVRHHFNRECVMAGQIRAEFISTKDQHELCVRIGMVSNK
jgi:hypothetical protein